VHGMLEEDNQDVNMQEKSDESLHNQKSADKQTAIHPSLDHMQSRLLTKKQLSDMAFGIRELSKRLGRVRLMLKVKNIFILTKAWDASLIAKTADLSKWLLDQHDAQYTVYVEDKLETSKSFDAASVVGNDQSKKTRLKYWNDQMCQKQPHKFDIILAVSHLSPFSTNICQCLTFVPHSLVVMVPSSMLPYSSNASYRRFSASPWDL
jgi:NAD+ kinase